MEMEVLKCKPFYILAYNVLYCMEKEVFYSKNFDPMFFLISV